MNTVELRDKKAVLKQKAYDIIETCKKEIRDFTVEESDEIKQIEDSINKINDELRSIENELSSNNKEIKTKSIMKEFRLLSTINEITNNKTVSAEANAVINKGIEEMRKAGVNYGGQIQLPVSELRTVISVANEGEDVVETEFTNILEPLRAKNVLMQAGARYLGGLVGDVQVPIMAGGNVTWEGETAPAKDGAGSFSNVKLQPKRLTAYVDVTKQFLVQDSLDAENMIKADIVNAINTKLEETILGSGAGTSTQPAGIFNGVSGSVANFADLCNMEANVEDANINGECAYIMSNKAKAAFRNMPKSAKTTQLVMEGGQIDGTPVYNTSHVEGKNVAYGDFSNLVIGQWGAIDLTVDPYTKAADGQVRLVVNVFYDAKVLREGAIQTATVGE